LAKAVANGLPLGVTVAKKEIMSSLNIGEHSSTFGGNPVACAAASATIDTLLKDKLPERAARLGKYFLSELKKLEEKYKVVRESRGLGLMIGVELRFDILNILLKTMERGVLILDAGRNVMRFLPPLIIDKPHIEKALSVINEVLGDEENARLRR
jgi:acetylornithine/LysW-gamma-L-lysine aminotransferase